MDPRADTTLYPTTVGGLSVVKGVIAGEGRRPKRAPHVGFRPTVLLVDVHIGSLRCDHLWIDKTRHCCGSMGDTVTFTGRIVVYNRSNGTTGLNVRGMRNFTIQESKI